MFKVRGRRNFAAGQAVVSGYMTVEAACTFVMVLSVVVFAVSLGIYEFERCVFELEGYYEMQKTIQTGKSMQDYISIEGRSVILSRQKATKLYGGIWGKRESLMQVEIKVEIPDPVLVLRLGKRLLRMQEDEHRESESAVAESIGE